MICTCPVCVVTETNLKLRVKSVIYYFQSRKFGLNGIYRHQSIIGFCPRDWK